MHADSSHARSICLVGSSRQYPDYNQSPFPGYRTGDAAAKGRPSPPVPGPRWLIGIVTDSDTSIWVLFLFLWFRSYHVWSDNRRYFGCIAPKGTAGNHFLPLPLVHELGPTVTLLEEGFDVFFWNCCESGSIAFYQGLHLGPPSVGGTHLHACSHSAGGDFWPSPKMDLKIRIMGVG